MLQGNVLRGNQLPNKPGMLRDNVLRGNGVSFQARNGKMWPPARESAAKHARNPLWQHSAQEWGIFSSAERKNVTACAGISGQTRPESSVATFCAGKGYLFTRQTGNCSRLRRNQLPNTPGTLCLKGTERTKKAPALLQVLVIQLSGPNWA